MKKLILYSVVLFVFLACEKKENRSCWKVAGDKTTIAVPVNDFEKLLIGPHLEVKLVEDDSNFMIVHGHENLVNLVSASVNEEGLLTLENKNKCNFLRRYSTKKMEVELHFKQLYNLEYRGSEPLTNADTLHIDWFTFLLKDGSGSVDLTVDSKFLFASISHGYGDFTMRGKADYAKLTIRSNGFCNTENLEVKDSLAISNYTPVHSYINAAVPELKAEVGGSGNIYYIGEPVGLIYHNYGSGELIDNN